MNASREPSDDDKVEVLLFDVGVLHKSVHESARLVCSERGIPLREIDLTYFEDEKLVSPPDEKLFPQCVLVRGSKVLSRNSAVIHTPKTFSLWLNWAFERETRKINIIALVKESKRRGENLLRTNGSGHKGELRPKNQERLKIRQMLKNHPSKLEPSILALHKEINRRHLTRDLPKVFMNFR